MRLNRFTQVLASSPGHLSKEANSALNVTSTEQQEHITICPHSIYNEGWCPKKLDRELAKILTKYQVAKPHEV